MTNENAVSTERAPTLRQQLGTISLSDRGLVPTNIDELFRLAQAISISKICPPGWSETDCFVVIATGLEIGLSPFSALQNSYIVNNRVSIFGDVALGLIRARGLLEDYEQEYFGTPFEDNYGCRVASKRKGMTKPIVTEYTVADARRARRWELYHTGRNGEKVPSPWITDPRRMLLFRARSFNLRDNFGDVLKGVSVDTDDDEVIAGFEHAKTAVGQVVAPNFDTEPKAIRQLGVEPPTESMPEPNQVAPVPTHGPPTTKRGRGRPPKSDLFDPPKPIATPAPEPPAPAAPELSKSAAEVLRRLQADNLELSNFIRLMQRNEYLAPDASDLASVEPDGLQTALDQWEKVCEHLRSIKHEDQTPFA